MLAAVLTGKHFSSLTKRKWKKLMLVKMLMKEIVQCEAVLGTTEQTIHRKRGRSKKTVVPRRTKESQNKTFKIVKRTQNLQNLTEFKRLQASVRKTIKNAKKDYWRNFCNSIGRETEMGKI